jgi:hypothetical protein
MNRSHSGAAARAKLAPVLTQLQTMTYHRIVFAACGFSRDVQYMVREYNRARGRGAAAGQPQYYIHLLDLEDIKPMIGTVYNIIKHPLTTSPRSRDAVDSIMFADQWRSLTTGERANIPLDNLKTQVNYRHIDLEQQQPTRALLLKKIDEATSEASIAELLAKLDPHFDIA